MMEPGRCARALRRARRRRILRRAGSAALIVAFFAAGPAALLTFLPRRDRAAVLALLAAGTAGALASAWGYWHFESPPGPVGPLPVAHMLALEAGRDRATAIMAGSAAAVGGSLAGLVARLAWSSPSPRSSALLGGAAAVAMAAAALPGLVRMQSIAARDARLDDATRGYAEVSAAIAVRASLVPGYDVRKAVALEAAPVLYAGLGMPTPAWASSEAGYEARRAAVAKLRREGTAP